MISSLETSSPVSTSTLVYLMRWPVFLLIWLKDTFSLSDVAGNSATGQVTSDSRKKPFQFARGAIFELRYYTRLNLSGGSGFHHGHSGQLSPTDSSTSPTAATASSGDKPANGSSLAILNAIARAWGSARSFAHPCSSHLWMAPASHKSLVAHRS